jgi:flagellar motor switch protein FliM
VSEELSQEYIDELISTMQDDGEPSPDLESTPTQSDSAAAHARLFERTKRFSRQVLVLTEALHEQFAQETGLYLSTQVGGRAVMNVKRIEEVSPQEFNQFLDSSSESTVVAVFEFKENPGLGVLQMETSIALLLYERMCGGVLGGLGERRKLTEIEFSVVRNSLEHILTKIYPGTWKPFSDIEIVLERIQTGREATLNLMDPWAVILITMDLRLDDDVGQLYISLPYAMLEPFLDSMEARQPLTGSSKAIQKKYQGMLRSVLQTVNLDLEVMLGHVDMRLDRFSELEQGDVIILNKSANVELPVLVEGRPKYLARPGRLNSSAAIQISELLGEG